MFKFPNAILIYGVSTFYLWKVASEANDALGIRPQTDFCPRLRQFFNREIKVADALQGMNITAAIRLQGEEEPIWKLMMDEVARQARFNVEYFNDGIPEENETWNEKLFSITGKYDVSVDWWPRRMDRLNNGILFPEGWWEGDTIIVVKTEEGKVKLSFWAFLTPFSTGLWISILFLTIFTGFIYHVTDFIRSYRVDDCDCDSEAHQGVTRTIYLSMNAFVGHSEFDPKSNSLRLLTISMNFLYLILLAAYTANLASFLVVRNSSQLEINEFTDVIENQQKCCVRAGYSYVDVILQQYPGAEHLMVPYDDPVDMFSALNNGTCNVVLTSTEDWRNFERDEKYNKGCAMKWVGRRVDIAPAGFALHTSIDLCRTLLYDVLDYYLIQMKADGTAQAVWDNYRDGALNYTCDNQANVQTETTSQLNVFNLAGIFSVHMFVIAVIIITEIVLVCIAPKERKIVCKKKLVDENMATLRKFSLSINKVTEDEAEMETSALNGSNTKRDEVNLPIQDETLSRRQVALYVRSMEQNLMELKDYLDSNHSDTSVSELSN